VVVGQPDASGVPLLRERPLVDGAAAAYVCRGFVCERPVTDADALAASLRQ
ncbi:MAG: thymidylate kinase, partial [Actinomycetota bacterium]|nr:thymidylate kinase [Actinomycetota bacterium]